MLLTLDESRAQIVDRDSVFVDDEGRFEFTGFTTGPGLTHRVAAADGLFTPSVDLRDAADWSNIELGHLRADQGTRRYMGVVLLPAGPFD